MRKTKTRRQRARAQATSFFAKIRGAYHTDPPMLWGTVQPQYIRCGRPNCRCRREGQLHGPYHYWMYWEGGIQHKTYIPKDAVPMMRLYCGRNQELQAMIRENNRENMEFWRQARALLRVLGV